MQRRLFLLGSFGMMAGCATAPLRDPPVAPIAVPIASPPSTPPPPVPPTPPDMGAFLTGPDPVLTPTGDARFDAWVAKVLEEGGSGWRPYLLRVLKGVRPGRRVLDEYNAERAGWITSVPAYIDAVVTPARIAEGRRQARTHPQLAQIARQYRIPVEVLAAYWGAATDYGRQRPQHDLITTIATLQSQGLGRGWGHWDIYNATAMIASGRVSRAQARSFADGSMGQIRWHPDWYLEWTADGDRDGRIDIWNSEADALASVANRLGKAWDLRDGWVHEVIRPGRNPSDPAEARQWLNSNFRLADLRRADGRPWLTEEFGHYGQLLLPASAPGRAFLAMRNFYPLAYSAGTIDIHNDDETTVWGIAVGLLAHRIREG